MKKNKLFLLILLALIILPSRARAANVRLNIGCSQVTTGTTTECSVTATSDVPINAIEGNISISGNASIVSVTNNGWGMPLEVTSSHFSLLHDTNKGGGNSAVGVINITIKGNTAGSATLSITGISGSDSNFETFSASSAIKNITVAAPYVPPTQATQPTTKIVTTPRVTEPTTVITTERVYNVQLTSLVVGDFNVLPEDNKYYVTVNHDTEEVDIVATVEEGIELIGTGKRTLAVGKNVIDIITKAPNGLEGKYQLIITRPEDTTVHDTSLSSLKIVDYKLPFKKGTLEYTISVPSKTTELYIIATSDNKDVVISGTGLQTLKKGNNKLYVKVQYGDKASTEYIINVKRSYKEAILIGLLITSISSLIGYIIYTVVKSKKNSTVAVEVKNKELAEINREKIKEKETIKLDNALGNGLNGALRESDVNIAPEFAIKEHEEILAQTVKPTIVEPVRVESQIPQVQELELTEVPSINEEVVELSKEPIKVVNTEIPTSDVNAFVPPVSSQQPEVKKQVKIIKKVVKPTPKVANESNYKDEQVIINNTL